MKRKLLLIMAAFLVVSVFLTACGGRVETAQGVTESTIKVGNSAATSGPLAPVGVPFKAGIEAYFKMVNEAGGVNGRKIEYIHQDDEFNPEKGKAALDRLINDEKVFALVGHFGTPIVGATLNDIKEAGIPAVYFATGTGILYNENATGKDRGIYPVQPVYPMEGRIMAAWAKGEFKGSKVGVIYTNDDAGKDLLKGIKQEAESMGDLVVIEQQVAPGAENVSAAVTKLKDENVDVVIIAAIQGTFPQIVKELAKQGMDKPAITTYVNVDQRMTEAVKADIAGKFDIFGNAWVDMSKPEIENYRKWIKETSKEDLSSNAYAMTGWIAAHFFTEGLKRVDGDLTWESYMNALESAPIQNPFGGTIDFSEGKRLGTQQMSLSKMNPSAASGWESYIGFKGIDEILGN
ncbi:ABC-type branched-chain amino acid transport system, substrate-binding protein [Geosporobacter subterraneus DSM 17957]|uniref:ABC-type branched-chain amino acid transport system, substrate-binding protein n=1 Tax=Geosporobacter subterraneus DSM 17957 TaxID=1121919 RepID=A0A1M6F7U2_9FIRM|nr:ABC transporter substrate-binding protein [Geosporobacter subterraneus]SHI93732.1 ABC-type branched-chain amino acid transport system, substrate-binding protein [Geosporobacter subterraneus DSM 17957]